MIDCANCAGDSKAANKTVADFNHGVGEMVTEDASFSLYMAHGGTSFGFWPVNRTLNRTLNRIVI